MTGSSRARRERKRGQSMVEFALIAPTFFLLLFGIVEFGLLMFDVASTRYATGEAAKVEAYVGNTALKCNVMTGNAQTTCTRLHSAGYSCDADCQAIVAINNSPVGTTSLETINWIEIRQCPNASCPTPTCTNSLHTLPAGCTTSVTYVIRNGLDACFSGDASHCTTYAATGRSTNASTAEYLQVTVSYRYDWKTGLLRAIHNAPVDLNSSYLVRVEPQKF